MKRLVILISFVFSCLSISAQQNDPWQIVIDSCRNGSYSDVYPLARSLFEKSLKNGDSQELLRSAVYLCGVDYCFKESPMDSAVYRLNAIMPLLEPVERDVARALLVREYQNFCHYGCGNNKIQSSDNPAADYKYWGAKRCQDTIDALVERVFADRDLLREASPERFVYVFDTVSFSNNFDVEMGLTPTLYEVLVASMIDVESQPDGKTFGIDFSELLALEQSESMLMRLLAEWARGVENTGVENCLAFEVYRWCDLYPRVVIGKRQRCEQALSRELCRFDSLGVNSEKLASLYCILADMLFDMASFDSSLAYCVKVQSRWKGTDAAALCAKLEQNIRVPWASLYARYSPSSKVFVPALVRYKNLDSLYLLRYRAMPDEYWLIDDAVLRTEPLQRWSILLPKHEDVIEHVAQIAVPPMPQGDWNIVISTTPNPLDGVWGSTVVRSKDIEMLFLDTVVRGGYVNNGNVIVVDRESGKPLEGVAVTNAYRLKEDELKGEKVCGQFTARTDHRGVAFLGVTDIENYDMSDSVFAIHNGHRETEVKYVRERKRDEGDEVVRMWIDRPIYRQGDTLHFTLVAAYVSGFDKVKPLKKQEFFVVMSDYRDKKNLDSVRVVTDSWGEADGFFVLKPELLSGRYHIKVLDELDLDDEWPRKYDEENFRVEALRQPHFKILLEVEDSLLFLDRPFTIKGSVIDYSGMPVANALVRYNSNALKLTDAADSNQLETDSLGNFSITMHPICDENVLVYFNAQVTDASGETEEEAMQFVIYEKPVNIQFSTSRAQSQSSLSYAKAKGNPQLFDNEMAGKNANQQIDIPSVECSNTFHKPIQLELNCKLSRLRRPDTLRPSPVPEIPQYEQQLSRKDFSRIFPTLAYDQQSAVYYLWETDTVLYDLTLTTDSNGRLTLPVPDNLPSGVYKVEVNHPLSEGIVCHIVYLKSGETKPQTADMLYCEASSTIVEVGDTIRLRLATPLSELNVVVNVSEVDLGNLEQSTIQWLTLNNEIRDFVIPVTKRMSGKNIDVQVFAVKNLIDACNSFTFEVRQPRQLKLDISTFRDHIQSGSQQRWSLGVKDQQGEGQRARMTLTMFDKSLYQFLEFYECSLLNQYLNSIFTTFIPTSTYSHKLHSSRGGEWYESLYGNEISLGRFIYNVSAPRFCKLAFLQTIMPLSLPDDFRLFNPNLHGVITDQKTGEPMPFVNVILKQAGRSVIGAQTDFDGVYSFRNIPVGIYEMDIVCIGYRKNSSMVLIGKDGSTLPYNQQLIPTATSLDEVCIVEAKVPIIDFGFPESGGQLTLGTSRSNPQPLIPNPQPIVPNSYLRQNLSSLAFFRPDIVTNRKGKATLEFTAPDRLTEWDIFGVAWTKDMKIGSFNFSTVTSNPLMVQPLVPRFLRQGDTIDFAVKVSNASDSLREAQMTIELQGRVGEKDSVFFLQSRSGLKLEANASQTLKFRIPVPKDLQTARYKVTAQSPDANDGEQDYIPVLPNKELVTQSLAIYLNGKGEKHFTLTAPQNTQFSIVNSQFTVTPNPLWLALASMPYLQELKNPSTLYIANTLAADLMSQSVFKTYPQLMEKLQSQSSLAPSAPSAPFDQFSILHSQFPDPEALETRIEENLDKLVKSLNPDGGWSWMPERGASSVYVTRSILETLHGAYDKPSSILQHAISQALRYIDGQMEQLHKDTNQSTISHSQFSILNSQFSIVDYLYLRSLYPFNDTLLHPAFNDWYAQIKTDPLFSNSQFSNLHASARLAQIFYLNGDTAIAQELVRRLKQRSLLSEEMGMYWRDNLGGCYYYQRPIETQALLIETFALVTPQDTESVALMQQWLLKQKQTTHWGSDMATLAAIKALLVPSSLNPQLNNSTTQQLNNPSTTLKVGPHTLVAKDSFAPVTQTFDHFTPEMGEITLSKSGPGIVWGAAYLQYFAPLDSIPYNEMGIKLKKELYVVQPDGSLRMAKQFKVGDKVRVRILIDCDRTLEYLELKDQRSGAFEPCSTRSGWDWNDGLRYYVSVENSSTSCYIDHLDKGQYLVEYDLWVNASGSFSEGIATMQCLYAPEFRSNTPGCRIQVVEK